MMDSIILKSFGPLVLRNAVNKKIFLNPSSSLGKVRGILISQRKRKIKIRTIDGEQLPELLQSS